MECMTGFNHTITGALAAAVLPVPMAPFASFFSHFALDALPHFGRSQPFGIGGRYFWLHMTVDATASLAALGFALYLFPGSWPIILGSVFASVLPDIPWALRSYAPSWMDRYYVFHKNIQWGERPYGWVFEVAYLMIIATVLWQLAR